jgi:hypothetical protein
VWKAYKLENVGRHFAIVLLIQSRCTRPKSVIVLEHIDDAAARGRERLGGDGKRAG